MIDKSERKLFSIIAKNKYIQKILSLSLLMPSLAACLGPGMFMVYEPIDSVRVEAGAYSGQIIGAKNQEEASKYAELHCNKFYKSFTLSEFTPYRAQFYCGEPQW